MNCRLISHFSLSQKLLLSGILLICFHFGLSAQTLLQIDTILVSGQVKTKERIILRELTFAQGDTLEMRTLSATLEANQLRLMNTGLFSDVFLNVKTWDTELNKIGISVEVSEAWYVYPVPTFELADRNFNVWWKDYEHSLRRVNFGFNLYYSNVTGRQDYLKLVTQFGFTRKAELEYTFPYVNRAQTLGLSGGFLFTRNRSINYTTESDKQVFQRLDEGPDLLQRIRGTLGVRYRPELNLMHKWQLGFHYNRIDSLVNSELNPDFFLGNTRQRYMSLEYDLAVDRRNVIAYPTKGIFWFLNIRKEGFGIWDDLNQLYVQTSVNPYFTLNDHLSLGLGLKGRIAFFRKKQPFYNSRALGYEDDYVRGYEYYVIDGLDYGLAKIDFRFNFLDRPFNWGKAMPIASLKTMPLKVYLNVYNDFGYANNPYYASSNQLANELLWSVGVGLDILVYYNKLIQIQVSRNHLDEWGVFLHWTLSL
ncbi:MAG: BamA/TamA family outer membrane protein [Saprospiraceae bacterium]|nr:BamA/TamA family outer membrane protein [Saprospiraceae bacterium]